MNLNNKKLKILYLVYFSLEATQFLGVKKKILGQVEAFRKLGNEVDVAYCDNNKLIILNKEEKKGVLCRKGITNYRRSVYHLIKDNISKAKYDAIFIRFPGSIDYYLLKTAKIIKNHNTKFLLELPTYPIDKEITNSIANFLKQKKYFAMLKTSFSFAEHKIFKNKLYKENVKIVTYMPYDTIWKINTIVIDNGINIDQIETCEKHKKETDTFHILIVANMEKWHGIDRVIYGIKKYIDKYPDNPRKIKVTVIGDGSIRKELEELVKKEKLDKIFSFEGLQDGEKLNYFYSIATIAIGSLGLHRIGIKTGSTLKVKEYCAKGIPFVLSYQEREINDTFKFALKVPANEEPLDIQKCLDFFDSIKNIDYANKMYEFAKRKYDWKVQMKKIIDEL